MAMNTSPVTFPATLADRSLAASVGPFAPEILLEMEFGHTLDEVRLARAVALLLDAEPILGCRFAPRKFRARWEKLALEAKHVFTLARDKDEYGAFRNKPLQYFSGPQIHVCLYRSETRDSLMLKVSHLAADAASVKYIAARLSALYARPQNEAESSPGTPKKSRRSFWQIARHIPVYSYPKIFFNFLREIAASRAPKASHRAPLATSAQEAVHYSARHIARDHAAPLFAYAKQHRATVNDILLAATFRALAKTGDWDGKAALRLVITIDLRKYARKTGNTAMANFSSMETITYGTAMEEDFEATLSRVRAIMDKRKSSWLGLNTCISTNWIIRPFPYSLLKNIVAKAWTARGASPNTPDLFSNMGDIPAQDLDFDGKPFRAWFSPPGCSLPFLFFSCSGYNGSLTFSAGPAVRKEDASAVDAFFDRIISELPLDPPQAPCGSHRPLDTPEKTA